MAWSQTSEYASNRSAAMRSISDLAAVFGAITPSPTTTPRVVALVPTVTNLSPPTTMVADGLGHPLTIYGSNFQSGNVVQFKWSSGNRANVWHAALNAPAISSSRITVDMDPGTISNTFYVRVCRSQARTTASDCSSGLQYVTANPSVAVMGPTQDGTYFKCASTNVNRLIALNTSHRCLLTVRRLIRSRLTA